MAGGYDLIDGHITGSPENDPWITGSFHAEGGHYISQNFQNMINGNVPVIFGIQGYIEQTMRSLKYRENTVFWN